MTENTAMSSLPETLNLKILSKKFVHHYTYQADVTTNIMGAVSGGGTRDGKYGNLGFTIQIRNAESEPRGYYFKMVLFDDVAKKIVKREINHELPNVKPGYTATVDVELFDYEGNKEKYQNLFLEDIYVKNAENKRLAHFQPNCHMATEAYGNMSAFQKATAKASAVALLVIGVLIIGGVVVGALSLVWKVLG